MADNQPETAEQLELARIEAEEYAEEYAPLLVDKRGTYSVAQVRQQMRDLETLYTRGVSNAKVEGFMLRKFGCSRGRTKMLLERIREKWLQEDIDNRPAERGKQIRRLYTELEMALDDHDHAAIYRYEKLLAEIHGTKAPLQVDVNIRDSVDRVLMDLTGAEAEEMLAEYQRMQRIANEKEPLLLEQGDSP